MPVFVICIIDGMSDPPPISGGRTPLAAAVTPHLDALARHSVAGLCHVIPKGAVPGSEAGLSALLGCSRMQPLARAPIEALALGHELGPDTVAWRLNLMRLTPDGGMGNPTPTLAPHQTEAACDILREALQRNGYRLLQGEGFRHLCTGDEPPCDRPGPQQVTGCPPAAALRDLAANQPRLAAAMTEATRHLASLPDAPLAVWPWGCGTMPQLTPFATTYGHDAVMVGAVPLARGLARVLGMEAPAIAGATGGPDTDLAAKLRAAVAFAATTPVVFIHVESPDLLAHARDGDAKRRELERIDDILVGGLREALPGATLLVTCDHATDSETGAHLALPVPFILHTPPLRTSERRAGRGGGMAGFCEATAAMTGVVVPSGPALLRRALAAAHG